jgi:biotin carboxylase
MASTPPKTILCITSYEKGQDFLRECKRQGCTVILVTATSLEHANWPRESIDELFYMPDLSNVRDVIHGISFLARSRAIDSIVALDDYDVQTVAALREHLRMPGIGDSMVRYFRDKLAMRVRAAEADIPVPDFVHVLNYDRIRAFMARVPPPWVLKPRGEASTIGITKIASPDEFWAQLDELGDRQSFHVLERYVPGQVYHVDSIVFNGQVVFAEAHQYGRPPLDVFHEGGIFITRTVPRGSADELILKELCLKVITAFGLQWGVTHMEFIKGHDDERFYFLETAMRAGGANIADLIEAATGINLWREWARVEIAQLARQNGSPIAGGSNGEQESGNQHAYQLPARRHDYAGLIITLARQEHPDVSAYQDPEIVWRMDKRHHAGLIVAANDPQRVQSLLDAYSRRFANDFLAVLPPWMSRPGSTDE